MVSQITGVRVQLILLGAAVSPYDRVLDVGDPGREDGMSITEDRVQRNSVGRVRRKCAVGKGGVIVAGDRDRAAQAVRLIFVKNTVLEGARAFVAKADGAALSVGLQHMVEFKSA